MKRFITYLFTYENGIKGKNIGFIRTDQRDDTIDMEIHVQGMGRYQGPAQVYLLVKGDGLQGIPIGEFSLGQGRGTARIRIQKDSFGENAFGDADIVGVGVRFGGQYYAASSWKDTIEDGFTTGAFQVWQPEQPSESSRPVIPPEPTQEQPPENTHPVTPPEPTPEQPPENTRPVTPPEPTPEQPQKSMRPVTPPEPAPEQPSEPDVIEEPSQVQSEFVRLATERLQAERAESGERDQPAPREAGTPVQRQTTAEPATPEKPAASERPVASEKPATPQQPAAPEKTAAPRQPAAPSQEAPTPQPAEESMQQQSCVSKGTSPRQPRRIDLSDIRKLPKRNWYLCNNSFLIHGFFNYHYLIVWECEERGEKRTYLGVPGIYERPERMMALLFGFPDFRLETDVMDEKCPQHSPKEEPIGKFGYWLCPLEM